MPTRDILLLTTIMLRIGTKADDFDPNASGCNHQLKQHFNGYGMYDVTVVARSRKRQLVCSELAE